MEAILGHAQDHNKIKLGLGRSSLPKWQTEASAETQCGVVQWSLLSRSIRKHHQQTDCCATDQSSTDLKTTSLKSDTLLCRQRIGTFTQPPWCTKQEAQRECGGDGWCDNGFINRFKGVVNCLSQGVGVPWTDGSSGSASKFPPFGTQKNCCRLSTPRPVDGVDMTSRNVSRPNFKQRATHVFPAQESCACCACDACCA